MIHWSDIGDKFIHIHRQQLKSTDESGKEIFYEVGYTKDERTHPHGGRFFPITDEIRFVLELAKNLPGKKSDYVFHDKEGKAPSKDSYAYHLRRRCQKHDITTTNNHAFRMAVNTKLIEMGVDSAKRALILGHSVETNERHYSLTDRRMLEDLENIFSGATASESNDGSVA